MWEVARRYNETYINVPGGHWEFESQEDYINEAHHFAQEILREVSLSVLSCSDQ
jgi:hypothetical protein